MQPLLDVPEVKSAQQQRHKKRVCVTGAARRCTKQSSRPCDLIVRRTTGQMHHTLHARLKSHAFADAVASEQWIAYTANQQGSVGGAQ
jgi:hypothetical protein